MLELIKYALGGNAAIMPAVHDNVTLVSLEVAVGERVLEMSRGMDARLVEVYDQTEGFHVGSWATTQRKGYRRASEELLAALGLPPRMRVPKRPSQPTGDTVPISFFDVYRYVYLSQNSIDTSVVGHNDTNLNVKRRAVFELLYELTNPHLLEIADQRGRLAAELVNVRSDVRALTAFLLQTEGQDEESLRLRLRAAQTELQEAEARLHRVRRHGSNQAQSLLLDEVNALRAEVLESDRNVRELREDIAKARAVLAQLAIDEEALLRVDATSRSLSGIEFVVCPRCLQGIRDRVAPPGHCTLCLQSQSTPKRSRRDVNRIHDQRREVTSLLEQDEKALVAAIETADLARDRLSELLERMHRPAAKQSPSYDDVEEAARAAALASSRVGQMRDALARWAMLNGRREEVDNLTQRVKELAHEEATLRAALRENNQRLNLLSERYNEVVRGFNVPWYDKAEVNPKTYLPTLSGQPFDKISVGGARKTLVNLAYHLANLIVSIEDYSVMMPTLLVVDSPRKNVGENEDDRAVADAVYRRLRLLQDASQRPFQIIVADNDLPSSTNEWDINRVPLSYDRPLVPGVLHPGERVETLADAALSSE